VHLYYAMTAHGLGHVTRNVAVLQALRTLDPGLHFTLATGADPAWLEHQLGFPVDVVRGEYEPGTLHRNCFELDLAATDRAYREHAATAAARRDTERQRLLARRVTAVVADTPSLPIGVGAELGLPTVGIGNFTWDWILEPLLADPVARRALTAIRRDYAAGALFLRLPFGPPDSPFRRTEAAPLVSRRARLTRAQVHARLGIPAAARERIVLVCPGGWSADDWPAIEVRGGRGLCFVLVGDLPVRCDAPAIALPHALPHGLGFADLVGAADVVLAKPGYGIASECATHRVPMVAIERPAFPETPLLLAQFRLLGPLVELSLADFFAGRWEAAVRAALDAPPRWADLAEAPERRIAERMLSALG